MQRTQTPLMTDWEFRLNEGAYARIDLPHDWAIDAPLNKDMAQGAAQGYLDRYGVGYYRKTFVLDSKGAQRRYMLDFGGIYERSEVRLNGQHVGGWNYGYSSFRLDVTDAIRVGDNLLEIRVDNTLCPVDRWYSGCGIYRDVKLIETASEYIDERDVIVTTRICGDAASVSVHTGICAQVVASLSRGDEHYSAQSEQGVIDFMVENAALWSAENPNLYELKLSLADGTDSIALRVGIRAIVMDSARGMLVNGQPTKIKGVCIHQDVGCRGNAAKKEIWRERLQILKEMGCNAIRTAHHTHSRELLDLCDEMGFYVYAEPFDKWTGGLYGRYFESDWQKDVDAMLLRDRNHPCIFMWGVGNEVENQAQDSMIAILQMLVTYVKSVDDTRPVCYAMNPHFKRGRIADLSQVVDIQKYVDEVDESEIDDPHERVERIARIAAIVDVIGCNYQEQWYELIRARCPDKLILGTETYQYFMGHMNQMQNMTDVNPQLIPETREYVIGSMIWSGFDYLGESMGWPSKGWSGAPIRTNMKPRPVFHILKSYWSKEPMVHFSVMDYSLPDENIKAHWDTPLYADHWHFPQFGQVVIPYMIASNCDEVQLYLNGKRFYLSAPTAYPNRLITGFIPWIAGEVHVVGLMGGIKVCEQTLVTPKSPAKLAFDHGIYSAPAEEGYELLASVRVLDEDGNPCFRQYGAVKFALEGDAEILAVDNGCLSSAQPYHADSIALYHGVASVQIRLKGARGSVKVTASAQGLCEGRMVIEVGL